MQHKLHTAPLSGHQNPAAASLLRTLNKPEQLFLPRARPLDIAICCPYAGAFQLAQVQGQLRIFTEARTYIMSFIKISVACFHPP